MRERITSDSWAEGKRVQRYEPFTTSIDTVKKDIEAGKITNVMERIIRIADELTSKEPVVNLSPEEVQENRIALADLIELAAEKNLVPEEEISKWTSYIAELRS